MAADPLLPTAIVLAAGIAAQVAADRLRLPSIVLLLAVGILVGGDGLALVDPSAAFAGGTRAIVALAVAVILFEGGLGLDVQVLRGHQRVLARLLGLGAATSFVAGTLAAHGLVGLSWPVAALYGSLMIVTGPTVITPLVARLPLPRRVKDLLVYEGVLIDPLGAVIALVVAEWVVGEHALVVSGWVVALRLATGAFVGVVSGLVMVRLLARDVVPEHLREPLVLAIALLSTALASGLSSEAGLVAAVAHGAVFANSNVRGLGALRTFKEAIGLVLLSFVFVLLAADLRLAGLRALGWPALAVVAILVFLARPLGVLLATVGSELGRRERLFVSWICPRGVVAIAVAGLFRGLLDDAGIDGGSELEGLVFLTVAATVTFQGLTAGPVARLLGLHGPALGGAIIVGANPLGRLVARELGARGRQVVLVDNSPLLCRQSRAEGFTVLEGDALAVEVLEAAGIRYAATLLALTRNPELNELVCHRARTEYRVPRLAALFPVASGDAVGSHGAAPFPGHFPGIDEANRRVAARALRVVERTTGADEVGRPLAGISFAPGEFGLVVLRGRAALVATGEIALEAGDRLVVASPG